MYTLAQKDTIHKQTCIQVRERTQTDIIIIIITSIQRVRLNRANTDVHASMSRTVHQQLSLLSPEREGGSRRCGSTTQSTLLSDCIIAFSDL